MIDIVGYLGLLLILYATAAGISAIRERRKLYRQTPVYLKGFTSPRLPPRESGYFCVGVGCIDPNCSGKSFGGIRHHSPLDIPSLAMVEYESNLDPLEREFRLLEYQAHEGRKES